MDRAQRPSPDIEQRAKTLPLLVRGKQLRSETRRAGAELAHQALVDAVRRQGLTQSYLAARLGVPQTWVEDVLAGRSSAALGDAFALPRSVRRALALALLQSAENDNHG